MITRNQSHEFGVAALYSMLIYIKNNQEFAFDEVVSGVVGVEYPEVPLVLKQTLVASLKHLDEIEKHLEPHLTAWKFSRLNIMSQAILIYSYAFYTYIKEADKAIVINVAVKLSKLYIPTDEYKFINAVLDGALNG